METIADILLVAGALAAGFYCFVLSRKLNEFKSSEDGIGAVVADLATQVDELSKSVSDAKNSAERSTASLGQTTKRAEGVAQRLELLVASMHDIPDPAEPASQADEPVFSTRLSRMAGE